MNINIPRSDWSIGERTDDIATEIGRSLSEKSAAAMTQKFMASDLDFKRSRLMLLKHFEII
jgi:hypothetical protein